jgi:nitroimidazol reductase NimA-like FMN-containing flavoprotein (pyridoxamine 5'-phosphate oxidase superfamily)
MTVRLENRMSRIHVRTRRLDETAAEALLAKHHVGSLALAFHDRVTIELVNYIYSDRWIYGRMEEGPDLTTLRHHPWVAFETSEVDGIYDWRTVTAHGSVQLLFDDESTPHAAEYRNALELVRGAVPAVFTPRDPMPQRVQLFRLYANTIEGREARSDAAAGLPPA